MRSIDDGDDELMKMAGNKRRRVQTDQTAPRMFEDRFCVVVMRDGRFPYFRMTWRTY